MMESPNLTPVAPNQAAEQNPRPPFSSPDQPVSIYRRAKQEMLKDAAVVLAVFSFAGIGIADTLLSSNEASTIRSAPNTELERKHTLTLDTPALQPEIKKSYTDSVVYVHTEPKPKYNVFGLSCTGISIGHDQVATAAHCLSSVSDQNGDFRNRIAASGADKMKLIQVIGSFGRWFHAAGDTVSPAYEPNLSKEETPENAGTDIGILSVQGLQASIPMADTDPGFGQAVYVFSENGKLSNLYGGRVIALPDKNNGSADIMFRLDESNGDPCAPGTSGTGVINRQGELVGIVAAEEVFEMTSNDASRFGLSASEVGSTVVSCTMVPASQVRQLSAATLR